MAPPAYKFEAVKVGNFFYKLLACHGVLIDLPRSSCLF